MQSDVLHRGPGRGAFAELLASLRSARGLSQERLAAVSGLSVRAIGDLERGATHRPQRQTVEALANGLGLDDADRERLARAARPVRPAGTRREPDAPDADAALIGRNRELAGLVSVLERGAARMVSVLGPAGVGKTAVALAAVDSIVPGNTQVEVVRVDSFVDRGEALRAVAASAGAGPGGPRLVVLDGFDAARIDGAELSALLARHRGLRLLVTTRTPVRIYAEHRWPVGPLSIPPVPARPARHPASQMISRYSAVRLLVARLREVRPDFAVTDDDASAAASIVRRLDGNPMAIEVTAARLRTQSLSEVDADLEVELAGYQDRVLETVVRRAVDRLPRADAERLALLVALGRATPHGFRRALTARGRPAEHLDATVALLAAMRLVTVTGRDIQLSVPMSVQEAVRSMPLISAAGEPRPILAGHR